MGLLFQMRTIRIQVPLWPGISRRWLSLGFDWRDARHRTSLGKEKSSERHGLCVSLLGRVLLCCLATLGKNPAHCHRPCFGPPPPDGAPPPCGDPPLGAECPPPPPP